MIDVKKIILYVALALVAFLLWNKWQAYSAAFTAVPSSQAPAIAADQNSTGQFVPHVSSDQVQATQNAAADATDAQGPTAQAQAIPADRTVHITTDVLDVMIDVQGGTVYSAKLLDYQQAGGEQNNPYVLFNNIPDTRYLAQSGIVQADADTTAPLLYRAGSNQYELQPGQDQLEVVLNWQNDAGLQIQKTFKFERGSYLITVDDVIHNQSAQVWSGSFYKQLLRADPKHIRSGVFDMTAYVGTSISDPASKLYQKNQL